MLIIKGNNHGILWKFQQIVTIYSYIYVHIYDIWLWSLISKYILILIDLVVESCRLYSEHSCVSVVPNVWPTVMKYSQHDYKLFIKSDKTFDYVAIMKPSYNLSTAHTHMHHIKVINTSQYLNKVTPL